MDVLSKININQLEKTIIFLTIYPLSQDYAIKYGFSFWKNRGYSIKIINVFLMMYSESLAKSMPQYLTMDSILGVEQKQVTNNEELESELCDIRGWKISILLMGSHYKIINSLRRSNVNYLVLRHILQPESDRNLSKKIVNQLFPPKNLIKTISSRISNVRSRNMQKKFPPQYMTTFNAVGKYNKKTSLIKTNSFDYDRVLENEILKREGVTKASDYLVLLVNHPWLVHDYVLSGIDAKISKEEYSIIINRFLGFVENSMKIKVIIASYPKAADDENIYQGREYIKHNTEQLVKYSSGVIGHHTGALNFAVLHNKPICIISMKSLKSDDNFFLQNEAYARELCVPVNYIDTEMDCKNVVNNGIFEDENCYSKFKHKYLVSKKRSGERIWEVVSNKFENDIAQSISN